VEVAEPGQAPAPKVDDQPRLTHQPALDGLRGLAVVAVLLFHLGRLSGGFLGVDLFFVLSGFLITSLLVAEHTKRGRIDLRRFWARRARRLLPVLFLLLVGVGALLLWFTPAGDRPRFRWDALATVGYFTNWNRMVADIGYWESFAQKSPLDHTWSLAIEEQFYVVWPIVAVLVLGAALRSEANRSRWLGIGALVGAAISFGLLAFTYSPIDTNRAYFATDTRLGPTLMGAALALFTGGMAREAGRLSRWWIVAGTVAVGWMLWSVATMDGTASWYYRGGQAAFAVATLVVIRAVTTGAGGPLGWIVGLAPLRALGLISYGIYLWHWPVIVYMTPDRTNLDRPWVLDVARVVVTLAVATASYLVLEQRIRRGALRGLAIQFATVGAVAVTLVVVVAATWGKAPPKFDRGISFGPIPTEGSDDAYLLYPSEIPPGATKMLLVGDSGVFAAGPEVVEEAERRGDFAVATSAPAWCTIISPNGLARFPNGDIVDWGQCQDQRRQILRDLIDEFDPDVVVYYLANAGGDGDVRLHGKWLLDCDPEFDQFLTDTFADELELLSAGGARLVLTTSPHNYTLSADTDEKVDCRNATYREIVANRPGTELLDLDRFVWDHENSGDVNMFEDVVHLSHEGARLMATWLFEELSRGTP
jgi:peptidoglycan/LPS O-acetylase OafA/YrhL